MDFRLGFYLICLTNLCSFYGERDRLRLVDLSSVAINRFGCYLPFFLMNLTLDICILPQFHLEMSLFH